MRRSLAVVLSCLLVGGLAAAGPAREAGAASGTRYVDVLFDEIDIERDIVYGQARNSTGQMQQLVLDLYTPAGDAATDRGLYVWVHGSGFRVGNKSSAGPIPDYVRRGWVGVSISYRLRPELPGNAAVGALIEPASLPAFIDAVTDARHDAQAAVRWARKNAAALGIDASKIAIGGISAGGITALNAAFNPDDAGTSGTPGVSSAVAAAVSHAGTYAPVLLGAFPAIGAAPPIAMYHGTSDEQVPYPSAPLPCILTILMLNVCEYVTFVGRTHLTMGTDLARDFLYRHVILGRTELRTPLVADTDDGELTLLAGAELPDAGLGAAPGHTHGVVVPTDPDLMMSETEKFVRYISNAIGVPLPPL